MEEVIEKKKLSIDIFIPVIEIGAVVLVYIESIYEYVMNII